MEQTFFYIVGIALVVGALVTSAIGLRNESFPSRGALTAGFAVFGILVVATAAGAVINARDEQAHRDAENREAAEEAEQEETAAAEAEAPEGTGEAAAPDADAAGGALFTEAGCAGCHSLQAADATGEIGPNLDESLRGRGAEFIRTAIIDPDAEIASGFGPGTMPSNYEEQLSAEEIDALVDYLVGNTEAQR